MQTEPAAKAPRPFMRPIVEAQGPAIKRAIRRAMLSAAERAAAGPDPVDVHVGTEIRARRKLARMSQEKLAAVLGVTFQQVQKYERGANRVSASMIAKAAEALECHPGDFFPGPPSGGDDPIRAAAAVVASAPGGAALLDNLGEVTPAELRAVAALVDALVGARGRGD